ncbi:MAG TPA: hypothetical protein VN238_14265 [Solirubrobacteraceae bacterium]|nr:hypothetical protein [Solirubrobacteraceae bacterium]
MTPPAAEFTPWRLDAEEPLTLYRLLSQSAPASASFGETRITATKETIDDDVEDVTDDDILEL